MAKKEKLFNDPAKKTAKWEKAKAVTSVLWLFSLGFCYSRVESANDSFYVITAFFLVLGLRFQSSPYSVM